MLVLLYTAAMFLGSLLLFGVQPMFTRMVLPLLGGSPAVWNTAQVFFQATLLVGYLYAHLTTRWLPVRIQVVVHVALLGVVFAVIPIGVDPGWRPPSAGTPIPSLLGLLALSVGLPFLVVSTTAPLLQRWFASSGHALSPDPYFLYAASNAGGLLALVGYPLLVEPTLRLGQQSLAWSVGYGAMALLASTAGVHLWRRNPGDAGVAPAGDDAANRPTWRQRARWLLLAFAPSSLLLGVTLHISTNIAPSPVIWVIPLALYLLSFILVFARRETLKHGWMLAAQPILLIAVILFFSTGRPLLDIALHLGAFFVIAMVCHGRLANSRPEAWHLTEFFLWLWIGGLLGGVFAGLIAPLAFSAVFEYPATLILACALRPCLAEGKPGRARWDLVEPLALGALYLVLLRQLGDNGPLLLAVPVALVLYRFRVRPIRFALGAFVILVPGQLVPPESLLAQERSFFGVHRVMIGGNGRIQVLTHGTTIHGAQHREPTRWREPLTYYHRDGPLGQFFEHYDKRGQFDHIGAIGLGAGSLVCYRRSPQLAMTFFEIDLQVVRIATNSRYFRFFDQCGSGVKLVVGDGRRSLREVPDAHFDLLVLDAFSSDAIPVHLLTREALALYFSKLTGPGVLLVHISNRHLNLAPVVAALVADARLAGRVQHYEAGPEDEGFEWGSSWVAIARTETELAPLEGDPRWGALPPVAGSRPWTDDYSNIVDALDWRRLIGG